MGQHEDRCHSFSNKLLNDNVADDIIIVMNPCKWEGFQERTFTYEKKPTKEKMRMGRQRSYSLGASAASAMSASSCMFNSTDSLSLPSASLSCSFAIVSPSGAA